MPTKEELRSEISELKDELAAAQAEHDRIETLYQLGLELNGVQDENELLRILARPAMEAGIGQAELLYINLDAAGEPSWMERVAIWSQTDPRSGQVRERIYLSDFPLASLWLKEPDRTQFIADIDIEAQLDDSTRQTLRDNQIGAMALIPLVQARQRPGLLILQWFAPHEFTVQERAIYPSLSALGASAVENRRAMENLEKMIGERTRELRESQQLFQGIIDNSQAVIYVKDTRGNYLLVNQEFEILFDIDRRELIGESDDYIHDPEVAETIQANDRTILEARSAVQYEEEIILDDITRTYISTKFPLIDSSGQPYAVAGISADITDRKQAEEERERLHFELIESQRQAIAELSTPIIPVMDQIIILPLIGHIDTERAKNLTRSLLAGINQHRAKVVIIDITGVSIVDSEVAGHLDRTIRAARLKGAATIITGLSAAIAETIVDLGIDWSRLCTLSNLQAGLMAATRLLKTSHR